jgi:hypothetical protein
MENFAQLPCYYFTSYKKYLNKNTYCIPQYYLHTFCVFHDFVHFVYDPGQMPMRKVFPGFYTIFTWSSQKHKSSVLLYHVSSILVQYPTLSVIRDALTLNLLSSPCCWFKKLKSVRLEWFQMITILFNS